MKPWLEEVAQMGGVSAVSAIFGGACGTVVGWFRGKALKDTRQADTDVRLKELANATFEELIGNLRQDCADARTDAKEAKADVLKCEEKHADCERRQDASEEEIKVLKSESQELRAKIAGMVDSAPHTPVMELPRPVPAPRKPRARK